MDDGARPRVKVLQRTQNLVGNVTTRTQERRRMLATDTVVVVYSSSRCHHIILTRTLIVDLSDGALTGNCCQSCSTEEAPLDTFPVASAGTASQSYPHTSPGHLGRTSQREDISTCLPQLTPTRYKLDITIELEIFTYKYFKLKINGCLYDCNLPMAGKFTFFNKKVASLH